MWYRKYIKRLLDIILALGGLILLSPVMLVIAFLVRMEIGVPILFKQKRPGKDEKVFEMYKFRSMTNKKDEKGNLLADDLRLTEFGKKLRETSLDELPELFNILKGDMSVVGPRPQLVEDMRFMTREQRKRHMVLPGLTGLAQVNGRNGITWEEKFKWDLLYIHNISFQTDARIVVKTVKTVFSREGIKTDEMETAENLGDYLLRTGKINKIDYFTKKR